LASSLVSNACPTLATCQYGPITMHRLIICHRASFSQ